MRAFCGLIASYIVLYFRKDEKPDMSMTIQSHGHPHLTDHQKFQVNPSLPYLSTAFKTRICFFDKCEFYCYTYPPKRFRHIRQHRIIYQETLSFLSTCSPFTSSSHLKSLSSHFFHWFI